MGDVLETMHTINDALRERNEARDKLNAVYRERNRLVAFLTRCFPSYISYTDDPAWPVVFIETDEGQLSWHVSDEEAVDLFAGVERDDTHEWDGHDTGEKYRRLARIRVARVEMRYD